MHQRLYLNSFPFPMLQSSYWSFTTISSPTLSPAVIYATPFHWWSLILLLWFSSWTWLSCCNPYSISKSQAICSDSSAVAAHHSFQLFHPCYSYLQSWWIMVLSCFSIHSDWICLAVGSSGEVHFLKPRYDLHSYSEDSSAYFCFQRIMSFARQMLEIVFWDFEVYLFSCSIWRYWYFDSSF